MVTKDQLDLLRASRPKLNKRLDYTIDGAVETIVHSTLEAERIGQLNRGDRTMSQAVNRFKHNMAFKAREGFAKSQFERHAQSVPPQDRQSAEATWRSNAIDAHEQTLGKASNQFRSSIKAAIQGHSKPVDTDLGYGAGRPHPAGEQNLQSQQIKSFKAAMLHRGMDQLQEQER